MENEDYKVVAKCKNFLPYKNGFEDGKNTKKEEIVKQINKRIHDLKSQLNSEDTEDYLKLGYKIRITECLRILDLIGGICETYRVEE